MVRHDTVTHDFGSAGMYPANILMVHPALHPNRPGPVSPRFPSLCPRFPSIPPPFPPPFPPRFPPFSPFSPWSMIPGGIPDLGTSRPCLGGPSSTHQQTQPPHESTPPMGRQQSSPLPPATRPPKPPWPRPAVVVVQPRPQRQFRTTVTSVLRPQSSAKGGHPDPNWAMVPPPVR